MDDRLRIFLWIVSGGGCGAVLGSAFGGLTGALFAQNGGAAGTGFGRRVAEAFARTSLRPPSPLQRAALIGAADGFFFLGTMGVIAGALFGTSGRNADELLLPMIVGSVLLIGGAIFMGSLAYALTYRARECLYAGVGCFLGGFLAARLLGSVYGPVGLVPGMILGLFLCRAVRRYAPTFQPPRVGQTLPCHRSDGEPDITGTPHSRSDADSFRKPDSFAEG